MLDGFIPIDGRDDLPYCMSLSSTLVSKMVISLYAPLQNVGLNPIRGNFKPVSDFLQF
jgi:hypothetical protein